MLGLMLALGAIPPLSSVAQTSVAATPTVVSSFNIPDTTTSTSSTGKYPRVSTAGNTVHVTSNPISVAKLWSKPDTATSFPAPFQVGSTNGKTDFANVAVATSNDGTTYVVWILQSNRILLRRRLSNGTWEPTTHTVHATGNFMSGVDVTVSSTGEIFVAWNEDFAYRFRRSNDAVNWSGASVLTSKTPRSPIRLASGGNGVTVAAFGGGGSNDGHAFAGIWNGSSFDTADLTPSRQKPDFFADAVPAVGPNGRIYVAWRNAEGGLYYTERQSDGTWPISRLTSGAVYTQVGISVDTNNNLHIAWAGEPSGEWDLYYAFKPVNGDWQGPVHVNDDGLYLANPDLAASVGAFAYGHAVYEAFSGSNVSDRYTLMQSQGGSSVSATPILENGAPTTKDAQLQLTFKDIVGGPTQVRWRWGAAPTNAQDNSNGWQPWGTNGSRLIAPPAGIDATNACQPLVLYTQVRKSDTIVQSEGSIVPARIQYDKGVQADVSVSNPHMPNLVQHYGSVRTSDAYASLTDGASNGDPGYTRDAQFYLTIENAGDCSGLSSFTIPSSNVTDTIPSDGSYMRTISLAQSSFQNPGSQSIAMTVIDKIANPRNYSRSIIYDPVDDPTKTGPNDGLPSIKGGSFSVNGANSIIRTLTFNNINVTDNLYRGPNGRQFWGVWIANSRTPVSDPNNANLKWFPVQVTDTDTQFSVQWSLFSGLDYGNDTSKTGSYYVYVKFLDGAGNPSLETLPLSGSVQLQLTSGYSLAEQYLPQVTK
jgi:hypothetical protein